MKKAYQIKTENSDYEIQHEATETIRLNKFISSSGYCSRREADRLIEAGHVKVNGVIVGLSTKVASDQIIQVNETIISSQRKLIYIALYKPVGIICTTDVDIPDNIVTFMNHKESIFPIGRLDKESCGLILLTNDGDVVNKILRSEHHHEKEYIVSVNRCINDIFLDRMSEGVQIYNPVKNCYQTTKAAIVKQIDMNSFSITLTQGLNRQIRRMCTALGYKVNTLKRVSVMNIHLNDMKVGQWRYLSEHELRVLNDLLSTNNETSQRNQ